MIRIPEEKRYSVRELASLLRVGPRTIWRWVAEGRLPEPIRYSKAIVRFKESQIRAFLEAGDGAVS